MVILIGNFNSRFLPIFGRKATFLFIRVLYATENIKLGKTIFGKFIRLKGEDSGLLLCKNRTILYFCAVLGARYYCAYIALY